MNIAESVVDIVGNTPLLRCNGYMAEAGIDGADICAKLECMNPCGSTKDRAALSMISDAEEKGILKKGATIIEPTSGNTGIGIAAVAAARGYKCILTLPESMSKERRTLLAAYGARIVLTPASEGMTGSIKKAEELKASIPGSIILGQFDNPANALAHERTTGPEIWKQTEGNIDIFVATVGTGGTITGIGHYLKKMNKNIKIVAVEPSSSPVLSGGEAGSHGIQGIGAGFVPKVLDTSIYDEVIAVSDDAAYKESAAFARSEGVMVGISSGAALAAAGILAGRDENRNSHIVVLLPDSGDRYLSTGLFPSGE